MPVQSPALCRELEEILTIYERDNTFSWEMQPDGSWKILASPNRGLNDENVYYEDKLAVIWNINDSIFGFTDKFSCTSVCHGGEKGKAYGNKYSEEAEETADDVEVAEPDGPVVALDGGYAPAGDLDLGEYTCQDCVYSNTCPKVGQVTPAECGSFQWKSE